jgi:uncharacterized protein YndB with AHSA1/START domain
MAKKLLLGRGSVSYTTSNVFKMPIAKVWEGATQSKHLKKYFVDGMKGEFGPELKPVEWSWKQWGGFTITPTIYEPQKKLEWIAPSMDGKYLITITFDFLRKDGKTIFRITERGYKKADLRTAFMMCEGWTEFHCALKAYLLCGVDISRK